jgi:hypothetical protein
MIILNPDEVMHRFGPLLLEQLERIVDRCIGVAEHTGPCHIRRTITRDPVNCTGGMPDAREQSRYRGGLYGEYP